MHKKLNIKLLKNFFYNKRVVITGHTEGEEFTAEKILMKCPSKYNDGNSDGLTEITADKNS